jgi:hypothetical protein
MILKLTCRKVLGYDYRRLKYIINILSGQRTQYHVNPDTAYAIPARAHTHSTMSSAEDEYNEHDNALALPGSKKRRVQRACDICRRKKSKYYLSWILQGRR